MATLGEIDDALDEVLGLLGNIEREAKAFRDSSKAEADRISDFVRSLPTIGIGPRLTSVNSSLRFAALDLLRGVFDVQVSINKKELEERLNLRSLQADILEKLQRQLPVLRIAEVLLTTNLVRAGVGDKSAEFGWDAVALAIEAKGGDGSSILTATLGFAVSATGSEIRLSRIGPPVIRDALDLPLRLRLMLIQRLASEVDAHTSRPLSLPLPDLLSDSQEALSYIGESVEKDCISVYSSLLGAHRKDKRFRRFSIYDRTGEHYFLCIDVLNIVWEAYGARTWKRIADALIESIRRSTPDYFEVEAASSTIAKPPFYYGGTLHFRLSLNLTLTSLFCRHKIAVEEIYLELRRYRDEEFHSAVRLGLHYEGMSGGSIVSGARGDIPSPTCRPEQAFLKDKFEKAGGFDEALIMDEHLAGVSVVRHVGWPIRVQGDRLSLQLKK